MPLQIHLRFAQPTELEAEALAVGVLASGAKASGLPPALKALDAALDGALARLAAKEDFTGKRDQILSLPTLGRLKAERLFVLGLGDRRGLNAAQVRTFASKAARASSRLSASYSSAKAFKEIPSRPSNDRAAVGRMVSRSAFLLPLRAAMARSAARCSGASATTVFSDIRRGQPSACRGGQA